MSQQILDITNLSKIIRFLEEETETFIRLDNVEGSYKDNKKNKNVNYFTGDINLSNFSIKNIGNINFRDYSISFRNDNKSYVLANYRILSNVIDNLKKSNIINSFKNSSQKFGNNYYGFLNLLQGISNMPCVSSEIKDISYWLKHKEIDKVTFDIGNDGINKNYDYTSYTIERDLSKVKNGKLSWANCLNLKIAIFNKFNGRRYSFSFSDDLSDVYITLKSVLNLIFSNFLLDWFNVLFFNDSFNTYEQDEYNYGYKYKYTIKSVDKTTLKVNVKGGNNFTVKLNVVNNEYVNAFFVIYENKIINVYDRFISYSIYKDRMAKLLTLQDKIKNVSTFGAINLILNYYNADEFRIDYNLKNSDLDFKFKYKFDKLYHDANKESINFMNNLYSDYYSGSEKSDSNKSNINNIKSVKVTKNNNVNNLDDVNINVKNNKSIEDDEESFIDSHNLFINDVELNKYSSSRPAVPDGITKIKVFALVYQDKLVGYRFKTNKGKFDIKINVAMELDIPNRLTVLKSIRLNAEGDLLLSKSEKATGVKVKDVSKNKGDCLKLLRYLGIE